MVDQDCGELLVHTGVAGRSARLGHRLVIAAAGWRAAVEFEEDRPIAVRVTLAAASLDVISGRGGLTPLTAPERVVARGNMHRSLAATDFPEIAYVAGTVTATGAGYHLAGALTIRGVRRAQDLDLTIVEADGAVTVTAEVEVAQTDFGIKPFSLMMGSLKVADRVRIAIAATVPANTVPTGAMPAGA